MAKHIVCINRSTYYEVSGDNEIEAIDNALDGLGVEVNQITLDAFISNEFELSVLRQEDDAFGEGNA